MSKEKHYNMGSIEVKDFIADQNLNFKLGNVVKYVTRANHKGFKLDDLAKAYDYINYEIEQEVKKRDQAIKDSFHDNISTTH